MSKPVRILVVVVVVFALSFGYRFFLSYRQARNNPTAVRNNMATSAKLSCVRQAQLKSVGTSTTSKQIDEYCECTINRGLASFSDAELLAAADRGENLSADDRAKMLAASQICNGQVFSHP